VPLSPSLSSLRLPAEAFTAQLKEAGFTIEQLKEAGFTTAKDLKRAGCSAADLKKNGFTLAELKEAFTTAEIKEAFALEELKGQEKPQPTSKELATVQQISRRVALPQQR